MRYSTKQERPKAWTAFKTALALRRAYAAEAKRKAEPVAPDLSGKRGRKPRGVKQNGKPSLDLCGCCFSFFCDPMSMSREFNIKISDRLRAGLCPACGHTPCTCKSSLKRPMRRKS